MWRWNYSECSEAFAAFPVVVADGAMVGGNPQVIGRPGHGLTEVPVSSGDGQSRRRISDTCGWPLGGDGALDDRPWVIGRPGHGLTEVPVSSGDGKPRRRISDTFRGTPLRLQGVEESADREARPPTSSSGVPFPVGATAWRKTTSFPSSGVPFPVGATKLRELRTHMGSHRSNRRSALPVPVLPPSPEPTPCLSLIYLPTGMTNI